MAVLCMCLNITLQAQCPTWYIDSDGDGFGNAATTATSCTPVTGYVLNTGDCNDNSFNDQEWSQVGEDLSSGSVITNDMVIGPDGFPVVVFQNFPNVNEVTVRKFNGTTWVTLGTDPIDASQQMRNPDIAVDNNGNLYIAYLDFAGSGDPENKITVRKYNPSANTWELVGSRQFSQTAYVNGTPMLSIGPGGQLYIVYETEYAQDIVVMAYNGTAWQVLGTAGFAASFLEAVAIDTDAAGNVYVAFSDINDGRLSVMKYTGGAWTYVGAPGVSATDIDVPKIEIDKSGVPYVAYYDYGTNQVVVKKFTGGAWTLVGAAPVFSDYASFVSLALDLFDSPVVAFRDNFGNAIKVMRLDENGNWESAVQMTYDGLTLSLAIGKDNQPYLSFKDLHNSDRAAMTSVTPVPSPPDRPTVSASAASVCPGASVTLSVTAGDLNDAAGWQWYIGSCGGTPIGSGPSIRANASAAETYFARAEGSCLAAPSLCGSVAVGMLSPVQITQQPAEVTVCENHHAQFAVVATGTGLSYQWRNNGTDIPGATGRTLLITGVASAMNGSAITVVVTGTCGSVTSNSAVLNVQTAPALTSFPVNAVVCENGTTQFEVTATGSSLTYQWRVDGVNIPGATASTLPLNNVPRTDNGKRYDVVIMGSCGTLTSNSATLTVETPPAITGQPGDAVVCENGATQLEVTATGSRLTYQWRVDGVNIPGATANTLALNNVPGTDDGNSYDVVITGSCGSMTSNVATLTVRIPPAITGQPGNAIVCENGATQFEVTATGSGLTYQWRVDRVNIPGASANRMALNNVPRTDNGNSYDVVITGSCGTLTSNSATLTVETPPAITGQPAGVVVCENDATQFQVSATGSNHTYQWRVGGVNIPGAAASTLALSNVPRTDNGKRYDVVITGSCGTLTSNRAILTVQTPPVITAQPADALACANGTAQFEVTATGVNLTYQWRVNGVNIPGALAATLALTGIVRTDDGNRYDVVITGSCGNITSNGATLTVQTPPAITQQPVAATACENGNAQFTVVSTGTGLTYQWRVGGVNIPGATASTLALSNVARTDNGNSYDVVITGSCGTLTSNRAMLTVETAPAITAQPTGATACENGTAQFNVTATGAGLTYQWRVGGVNIPGATAGTLALNNIALTDNGKVYDVVVTGRCGNTTSAGATLAVGALASITTQPADAVVCENGTAQFTVSATGTGLTYQWRRNGVNIAGAVNNTLTINSVPTSYNGNGFDVVITSSCGQVTSSRPRLTVLAAPPITQQPVAVTACENGSTQFTVVATGTGLTYQWRNNGINIPGATGSTLTLNNVTLTDNGHVYNVVIAGCGQTTSTSAVLTVQPNVRITQQPVSAVVCEGGQATFNITTDDAASRYQWRENARDIPGATTSMLTLTGVSLQSAAYTYQIMVTGTCGSALSNTAQLTVNSIPVVSAGNDVEVPQGTAANLAGQATGLGDLQYSWTPAEFLDNPLTAQPQATPLRDMQYSLVVTDQNGCTAFDEVIVTVYTEFVIPNAFSPNHDGINDTWNMAGIEDYPFMTVEVVNRYGQPIYKSLPGYPVPWDGKNNGSDLPWGTYYYKIDLHNGDKVIAGWLELIR
jgi:gliding motility-associated-like protein